MKITRIQFERSGGFAGITQKYNLTLDTLPEEERTNVSGLVVSARFFELPATLRRPGPAADQFHYKILVESDQGTHEVKVDDGAVPPELQPLIAWLQAAARKR